MITAPIMSALLTSVRRAAVDVDGAAPSARRGSPDPAAVPTESLLSTSAAEGLPNFSAAAYCSVLFVVLALSLPWFEHLSPLNLIRGTHRDEMDLEQVARALPEGEHHIYTRFEWGEFLGWRLAPKSRVFMDGRIEIYPDDVWAQYRAVTWAEEGCLSILDYYDVDYLVLDSTYHQALIYQVSQSSDWQQTNQVGKALVFERKGMNPFSKIHPLIYGMSR
jgi:hypothetical protein